MHGRFYSLPTRQRWNLSLPFTTLAQVVDIGPTHHLIGHLREVRGTIGAFTFTDVTARTIAHIPGVVGC